MTRTEAIRAVWMLAAFAMNTHLVFGSITDCAQKQQVAFARFPRHRREPFASRRRCATSPFLLVTARRPGDPAAKHVRSLPTTLVCASRDEAATTDGGVRSSSLYNQNLRRGYRFCGYASLGAAAIIFGMPDRTMTTLLATKWGGATGFVLAAGLCRILESAAAVTSSNRLASDTYKRLNLGLLIFGGVGLMAIPGEAAFLNSSRGAWVTCGFLTVVRILGACVALAGWKKGMTTGTDSDAQTQTVTSRMMLSELSQGIGVTIRGLKVKSSKKALTYRNCLALVLGGIISSFMEGLFYVRYQTEFTRTWFEISLQWSAVARLAMIATLIYSLKDAAERDRLTGTTFMKLNLLVGAWAVLIGFGQAIYPLGFAAYRGVLMFAFAMPFFLRAYRSYLDKQAAADKE